MKILSRDIYRYSPAIFVAQQKISRGIKYHKLKEPQGNWWWCLCFVRHFLGHYVENEIDELEIHASKTMDALYMLVGVDLRTKTKWTLDKERKGFYYFDASENNIKHQHWIPLDKPVLNCIDIEKKLEEEPFDQMKNGFVDDLINCEWAIDIFIEIVEDLLVSSDTTWRKTFNAEVKALRKN